MNQQTLITIQGINPDVYLEKELRLSKFNLDRYAGRIVDSNTEAVLDLDNKILDLIPGFDRLGDLRYFTSKKVQQGCTKAVTDCIAGETKKGHRCDIIAHSLGTCIALNSLVDVDNVYLIGCPLSIKTWLANWVRATTRKRGLALTCKRMFYVYSPVDPICHHFNKAVKELLSMYNITPLVSDSHHGIQSYLDEIQVYREAGQLHLEI